MLSHSLAPHLSIFLGKSQYHLPSRKKKILNEYISEGRYLTALLGLFTMYYSYFMFATEKKFNFFLLTDLRKFWIDLFIDKKFLAFCFFFFLKKFFIGYSRQGFFV